MDASNDINEWRADRLGHVYFSRLNDLIINETSVDSKLFDYWIDIGENDKPTGRYFAVEVQAFDEFEGSADVVGERCNYLTVPVLLVLFDNNNDRGYYIWIKKPEVNGELRFDAAKEMAELNNDSLNTIVTEIKNWYSKKQVA